MSGLKIFISYSSKNRRIVEKLISDLKAMGHDVWHDTEGITGGHKWWAVILKEIRQCELFIPALTTHYFKSVPCSLEIEYASALQKLIFPIRLANIGHSTLPSYLQEIQTTDYQQGTKEQLLKLVKALNDLPQPEPLPNLLPYEPETPLHPIAALRDKIDILSPSLDEQRLLIANLKDLTEDEDHDLAAWELLEQLHRRADILVKPHEEIGDILAKKPSDLSYRRRLAALEPRTFEGHSGAVTSVAFSPDAQTILTGSEDFTARLWDSVTGETKQILSGHGSVVSSVAFAPDGHFILTGSEDRKAILWDSESGELHAEFAGHDGPIMDAVFSPDGQYILTGSEDRKAILWDTKTSAKIREFKLNTQVKAVDFSPNGRQILLGGLNKIVYLWDADSGELKLRLEGHRGSVNSVTFSPDGLYALSGASDHKAILWNIDSATVVRPLMGHTNSIMSVNLSTSGKYSLTGCHNDTVRVWDLETGQQQIKHDLPKVVSSVAFSPDDRYILAGCWDNNAYILESEIPT